MSRGVVTGMALAIGFLLQTAFLPALGVNSISPDLILAVLIPSAILWQPIPTAFMGAAAGLLVDILFGHGIGTYSITYLAAPWLAGTFGKNFYRENAFLPAGIAGAALIVRELWTAVMVYLGRMEIAITWGFVFRLLASALMTAVVAIPWHLMFYSGMAKYERRRPGMFFFGR
jgi:rod shape-determining protein MreD